MHWPGTHNVSVDDAYAATKDGAVLIDVRTSQERAAHGKPAGARHIPLDKLPSRTASLQGAYVLVICRSGRRSAHAASALRKQGVAAKNVKGGMLAWSRHGLPLDTSKGRTSKKSKKRNTR